MENTEESGLVGQLVTIRIERFPVQIPPSTRLRIGTQPCYEAPDDPWVDIIKMQCSTSGELGRVLCNGQKLPVRQPNSS